MTWIVCLRMWMLLCSRMAGEGNGVCSLCAGSMNCISVLFVYVFVYITVAAYEARAQLIPNAFCHERLILLIFNFNLCKPNSILFPSKIRQTLHSAISAQSSSFILFIPLLCACSVSGSHYNTSIYRRSRNNSNRGKCSCPCVCVQVTCCVSFKKKTHIHKSELLSVAKPNVRYEIYKIYFVWSEVPFVFPSQPEPERRQWESNRDAVWRHFDAEFVKMYGYQY